MCKEKEHLFFSLGPNLLENPSAYCQHWKSQFLAQRYKLCDDFQQYLLRKNEQFFNYLDYKPGEVSALPFYKKPNAYFHHFKCDELRRVGRTGIQYCGGDIYLILHSSAWVLPSLRARRRMQLNDESFSNRAA